MKNEKMPASRQGFVWLVRIGMWVATGLTALLTLCIVGYVLLKRSEERRVGKECRL